MKNQYSNIPEFELFDTCILDEVRIGAEFKEMVMHTTVTYSLSEAGELIKDEHLLDQPTDKGFNRRLSEVDNYEKYLNIYNGNVSGWLYLECRNEFLGKRNIAAYESLLLIVENYRKRFEDIKNSEFAQKIFKYFLQIQLEFENWFWQNDIEIPSNSKKEVCTNSSGETLGNLGDAKPQKNISQVDREKESIDKAIEFVNDEIKKCGSEYKKKEVIKFCANAYENIIPAEKKKKIITVAKYSRIIFPEIKHKFCEWKLSQFQKYLNPHLSVHKNQTKASQFLSIFFL